MTALVRSLSLLTGCLLLACSSEEEFEPTPPFEKLEDVRIWATAASAVSVYAHGYQHIAVADGKLSYVDPECPTVEDSQNRLTVTGGCTDSGDKEWTGSATVERDGDDRNLTLRGLNGADGTIEVRRTADERYEFEAHLVLGGVTTIDYDGSVLGGYDGPTLWNGSGHVKREGVLAPTGEIDASTLDQLVDNDVCSGQPVSGSTTLRAGKDMAVITYDGESDCDADQNAELTVNDEDRGLVSGINCSFEPPPAAGFARLALAGVVAGLWLARRRGSRQL